jgi:uncharacterized surface protein with fasciclin (FAS1) repeats
MIAQQTPHLSQLCHNFLLSLPFLTENSPMSIAQMLVQSRRFVLTAALVVAVSGCATMSAPVSVSETVAKHPSLSTLSGLLTSSGLSETLKGAGPFTVFAPSNDAFKAVPAKTMEALAKDPAALKNVLTYHAVAGLNLSKDVKNAKVKTVNGADIELSKAGEIVTVESAMVTQADVLASNGVVHIIDAVLIPPVKK